MKLNWLPIFASLALAGVACTKPEPKAATPEKPAAAQPKAEKAPTPVVAEKADNPACFGSPGGKAR